METVMNKKHNPSVTSEEFPSCTETSSHERNLYWLLLSRFLSYLRILRGAGIFFNLMDRRKMLKFCCHINVSDLSCGSGSSMELVIFTDSISLEKRRVADEMKGDILRLFPPWQRNYRGAKNDLCGPWFFEDCEIFHHCPILKFAVVVLYCIFTTSWAVQFFFSIHLALKNSKEFCGRTCFSAQQLLYSLCQ